MTSSKPLVQDPFQIHVETVVAASRMLGHDLENRSYIRHQQDLRLFDQFEAASELPLGGAANNNDFVIAPMDILVSRVHGKPQFHIIELNGSGIGGVSNMPDQVVLSVIESLRRVARSCAEPEIIFLLPVSGKESEESPRLNRLVHEKLIFAQAIQSGIADVEGEADVLTLEGFQSGAQTFRKGVSAVMLGYIKELMEACELDPQGCVRIGGRRVVGAANDRFCLNLISKFRGELDLKKFVAINSTYIAGGDKGVTYMLLDEYLAQNPSPCFPRRIYHAHAFTRDQLIAMVMRCLQLGHKTVVKPHGTGIGHGIEFFLDPHEPVAEVGRRLDSSIQLTEEYYGIPGGAFPYTISEFVDAAVIDAPEHRLHGHKFELRVVVHSDGTHLRACPTIAKVAPEPYDPLSASRRNLINNITHSMVTQQVSGTEFMLPLCCQESLKLLGITVDEMKELCRVAAECVRHIVYEIPRMQRWMDRVYLRAWNEIPTPVERCLPGLEE